MNDLIKKWKIGMRDALGSSHIKANQQEDDFYLDNFIPYTASFYIAYMSGIVISQDLKKQIYSLHKWINSNSNQEDITYPIGLEIFITSINITNFQDKEITKENINLQNEIEKIQNQVKKDYKDIFNRDSFRKIFEIWGSEKKSYEVISDENINSDYYLKERFYLSNIYTNNKQYEVSINNTDNIYEKLKKINNYLDYNKISNIEEITKLEQEKQNLSQQNQEIFLKLQQSINDVEKMNTIRNYLKKIIEDINNWIGVNNVATDQNNFICFSKNEWQQQWNFLREHYDFVRQEVDVNGGGKKQEKEKSDDSEGYYGGGYYCRGSDSGYESD